jgi:putative DNA primase/helicase
MTHEFDNNVDLSSGQARPPKPVPLTVIPEHIPAELKALPQWVCWRYTWNSEAGKWIKKPLRPKDGNATSHNAKEAKYWTSFEFAYQRYLDSQSESWRFDGIGLVLLPENVIVGFDLDHCREPETGEVKPWALDVVR